MVSPRLRAPQSEAPPPGRCCTKVANWRLCRPLSRLQQRAPPSPQAPPRWPTQSVHLCAPTGLRVLPGSCRGQAHSRKQVSACRATFWGTQKGQGYTLSPSLAYSQHGFTLGSGALEQADHSCGQSRCPKTLLGACSLSVLGDNLEGPQKM